MTTQPTPAAATRRRCHHLQDDHVIVLVLTDPVPMGLMYSPATPTVAVGTDVSAFPAGPNRPAPPGDPPVVEMGVGAAVSVNTDGEGQHARRSEQFR